MPKVKETCEKFNCTLEPNHDGWHVKKGARGKVIISWLDGEWKGADGAHGTYRYVDDASEYACGGWDQPHEEELALERVKALHPSNQS